MWNLEYTQAVIKDIQSELTGVCDYIKDVDYDVDISAAIKKRHALLGKEAKLNMILQSMQDTLECGDMDDYISRKMTTMSLIKEYQQLTDITSNTVAS